MIFEFRHGLIWLDFDIEYKGEVIKIDNCILDTGSASTAIDIDLVNFDYQKSAVIKRLFGIGGGTQEVVAQEVDKIIIDETELKDYEIGFGDIRADFGINGFIGNDILRLFIVKIDFLKQRMDLKLL